MISENNQNQNLETFIAIKIDAENNEINLAISFDLIHEDASMFLTMTQKCGQYCSSHNINRRLKKESVTNMESATVV